MENDLTADMIDRICSNLRAMDFLNDHQAELEKIPDFKKQFEHFSALNKQLMNQLSEEQLNKVLETHKIQKEAIVKKLQKKKKKK